MADINTSNIIYLRKGSQPISAPQVEDKAQVVAPAPSSETFEAIITKNKQNFERMQRERNKANKAILKSYRLK